MYYNTIIGQSIDLSRISCHDSRLVSLLIGIMEEVQAGMENIGESISIAANLFASQAREHIRRGHPSDSEEREIYNGPVGAVFKDCYLRLLVRALPDGQKQNFLNRYCFSPIRVLYERYIVWGGTLRNFADSAGLEFSVVSSLFEKLLKPDDTVDTSYRSIDIDQLSRACQNLGVFPLWAFYEHEFDLGVPRLQCDPSQFHLDGLSFRDIRLITLVAAVTRFISTGRGHDACRETLAFSMAWIYGARDLLALAEVVDFLFKIVSSTPEVFTINDSHDPSLGKFELSWVANTKLVLPPDLVSKLKDTIGDSALKSSDDLSGSLKSIPKEILQFATDSWERIVVLRSAE